MNVFFSKTGCRKFLIFCIQPLIGCMKRNQEKQVDMSGPPELLRLKLIENYGLMRRHFTSEINTHLKKNEKKN